MIIGIRSDKILLPSGVFDGFLYLENGKITKVSCEELEAEHCFDMRGKYVAPGFIEIHSHGAGGHPFLAEDAKEVAAACEFHLSHGTTSILPTLSASPISELYGALAAIKEAKDASLTNANIIGAHLEGPYLSPGQCGAQCTDFITPPIKEDYRRLTEKYGDSIARWTYAPENDARFEFSDYISTKGILLSAGHTDATYADIDRAISHGCRLVTHLYSCTSTVTRNMGFRTAGVIESAFLRDELTVEIIADGKHLPRELVQMIIKIKGIDNVILITDSLEIAGTNVKEGIMAGTAFIVEDGVCKLRDRSAFAGSVATSDTLLCFAVNECGCSVADTVKMMSTNPAELLGLNKGKLSVGYDADITVFNDELFVTDVFVGGKKVR